MKRTADTWSSSTQRPYVVNPTPGGDTVQLPATSTPPSQANPQGPPSITSSLERTSTAFLAVAAPRQAAVENVTRAADDDTLDLIDMNDLLVRVKKAIDTGSAWWRKVNFILTGNQKKYFLLASLYYLACETVKSGDWLPIVAHSTQRLGLDLLLKQKWPEGRTTMHVLAGIRSNKWMNAALAIEGQHQSLFIQDHFGHLPFQHALLLGNNEVAQSMLAHDDDAGSMRLCRNKTLEEIPLHFACASHQDSIVLTLLRRKGMEQRLSGNSFGSLALHHALLNLNIDVLPHLLAEAAKDQVLKQTNIGTNALMIAVEYQLVAAVDLLLAVPGALAAQLEARHRDGRGALDFARDGGNPDVIARIETAMQTLIATSTSTSTTSASSAPPPFVIDEAPVPLTPAPPTPASKDNPAFSDTEEDPD